MEDNQMHVKLPHRACKDQASAAVYCRPQGSQLDRALSRVWTAEVRWDVIPTAPAMAEKSCGIVRAARQPQNSQTNLR